MTIINASPDRTIQIGYEGEDRVTVLRFRYPYEWLSYGEGVFTVRVRRHGEHTAYNAQLVMDDRENTTLLMTVTNVELSVKGSGEMQVVCSGADFVKKSPIYSYNVSRAVDETVDPPAQDVYTQIIESLSDLQTDVQGLADAVDDIGDISLLTTTAKTDLVSAINEVNAKGGGGSVTVDDVLSDTSENPVQNKAITRSIRELSGYAHDLSGVIDGLGEDVEGLETAIQSKADIQTVSALADAVNGLDSDVQGLQTAVQAKADTATVTALSGTVSDLSDAAQQYMEYTSTAITNLRDNKANKSYVDDELAKKANATTVTALSGTVNTLQSDVNELQTDKAEQSDFSDLSENVATLWQTASQYMEQTETVLSGLQTGLASKVDDVQVNGTSIVTDGVGALTIGSGLTFQANSKTVTISSAGDGTIKSGTYNGSALTPGRQHISTFYGLAKAAGYDEKNSALPVGTYTEDAKTAIRTMLGLQDVYEDYSSALEAIGGGS